jgi:hypothetical protein
MTYGSFDSVPGGHNPEREPDDVNAERRRDDARDVVRAARRTGWFPDLGTEDLPGDAEALDGELMRDIAHKLNAHAFGEQGRIWQSRPAALLRAWDALLVLDAEARVANEEGARCQF